MSNRFLSYYCASINLSNYMDGKNEVNGKLQKAIKQPALNMDTKGSMQNPNNVALYQSQFKVMTLWGQSRFSNWRSITLCRHPNY